MRDGENWGLLITTIVQLPIRPHWQPRHHIHAPFRSEEHTSELQSRP